MTNSANLVDDYWYETCENVQNFSSIYLKLRLPGEKNTGKWSVNTSMCSHSYEQTTTSFMTAK